MRPNLNQTYSALYRTKDIGGSPRFVDNLLLSPKLRRNEMKNGDLKEIRLESGKDLSQARSKVKHR
jgi:hypothetical protein